MGRDEVIKLLKGGTDGIQEWNRQREAGDLVGRFEPATATRFRIQAADLSGLDLRGADLSGIELHEVTLVRSNLAACNLRFAILLGDFTNATFDGADLTGATFYGDFSTTSFTGCNLHASVVHGTFTASDLSVVNLSRAKLEGANLSQAKLDRADLSEASFFGVNFSGTSLIEASLRGAHIERCILDGANLEKTNLVDVVFVGSRLGIAKLVMDREGTTHTIYARILDKNILEYNDRNKKDRSDYSRVRFSGGICGGTIFADLDLSEAEGLDSIVHKGPSAISIDTLFRSKGKIPEAFLRGCGVPEYIIENQRAFAGSIAAIQFYSCFISYSTKDEEFAQRLHSKLREKGLRVWFAPHDIQGGKKLHEQIDEAIRLYDKLLLVLSSDSMNSEWVKTEIHKARKAELKEKARKLFPIRLVEFEVIRDWNCFDADSGKDLGVEIREYFIPDFTNWKDHDSFEAAFARLLNDLKSEESTGTKPA